ncbi:hypothetical protein ElyMa_005202800 [Elysia marginata]|uniref:Uncharacterized protein n=1 Tax=Elysia marginata TaxID=1093978 RepID=A0AAV4JYV2_9GAST|nr:hypothetical protein ElyMa_005202800 [Elysia marginata]
MPKIKVTSIHFSTKINMKQMMKETGSVWFDNDIFPGLDCLPGQSCLLSRPGPGSAGLAWVAWRVNFEVMSETEHGTIESVLPHCDVRSACVQHTQSHYPDTGPIRLRTKSIMSDTRRISC